MSRPVGDDARAYIGLGSNLGDSVAQVRGGMTALAQLRQTRLEACSSLYRTAPVGRQDQPDFVNAVCRVRTRLAPVALMRRLLEVEQTHGRVREGEQGGPRTLDLDLLLYEDRSCHEPGLTLPHPRLHERAFVLYPLQEIAPALVIPGRGRIEDLLPACAGQGIERLPAWAG
jgi:2-amino-4-hydroxy-6-hydroxymethyldihydropteridine diphosphokinase